MCQNKGIFYVTCIEIKDLSHVTCVEAKDLSHDTCIETKDLSHVTCVETKVIVLTQQHSPFPAEREIVMTYKLEHV